MKRQIAIDLDGVVINSLPRFLERMADRASLRRVPWSGEITTWSISESVPGLSIQIEKEVLLDPNTYSRPPRMDPIDGALEGLKLLSDYWDVVFITARPVSTVNATLEWLDHYQVNYSTLIFALDKGIEARRNGCNIIVDDNPSQINWIASQVDQVYLFDHPYNRGVLLLPNVRRVYGWNDLILRLGSTLVKDIRNRYFFEGDAHG